MRAKDADAAFFSPSSQSFLDDLFAAPQKQIQLIIGVLGEIIAQSIEWLLSAVDPCRPEIKHFICFVAFRDVALQVFPTVFFLLNKLGLCH